MKQISVLSQDTIDKIAAGEVVERPASIVKELVENSIDAGANAVTVEIRDGGMSLIRITDNGSGIVPSEVPVAFLRHATSKIRTVEDLLTAGTLGFRGEALSSIAAIAKVEVITKTAGSLTGIRYQIEGGIERGIEEVGAPEGTTFLVREMFYNTPARKKFLKSAGTEAGYISDLMERLALSHPEISFKFMNQGQTKLHTSGNTRLKDIIYGIYGRDIAANLLSVHEECDYLKIEGMIGKPVISRGNRNFENYYVNGRYVKSNLITRAIEEAYKPFMMNHRYPFTVLKLTMDGEHLDANVHPTKMEVRFSDQTFLYEKVKEAVKEALAGKELIPEFTMENKNASGQEKKEKEEKESREKNFPEPFETMRRKLLAEERPPYQTGSGNSQKKPEAEQRGFGGLRMEPDSVKPGIMPRSSGKIRPVTGNIVPESVFGQAKSPQLDEGWKNVKPESMAEAADEKAKTEPAAKASGEKAKTEPAAEASGEKAKTEPAAEESEVQGKPESQVKQPVQMEWFGDGLLSKKGQKEHKLIGQIFDTYWIVEFQDKMFLIDQHAAHEKVLYEKFVKQMEERQVTSQRISPPIVVTLTMQEEQHFLQYKKQFEQAGFEVEPFGGREYSIYAVPDNLYGVDVKMVFTEMIDGLGEVSESSARERMTERMAAMACKAAVKGKNRLSAREAEALIDALLELENPYHCPHGRPTIVSMTRYELEKKFKRIL